MGRSQSLVMEQGENILGTKIVYTKFQTVKIHDYGKAASEKSAGEEASVPCRPVYETELRFDWLEDKGKVVIS